MWGLPLCLWGDSAFGLLPRGQCLPEELATDLIVSRLLSSVGSIPACHFYWWKFVVARQFIVHL